MSVLFQKRKQSTAQQGDQSHSSIDFLCDKFRKVIVSENQVKKANNVMERDKSNKCSKSKKIKNRKFDHLMNTRPETFNDFNQFLYQRGHLSCQQTNIINSEKVQLQVQVNTSLVQPRERDSFYSELDICVENRFSHSHYFNMEESNLNNYSFVSDEESQPKICFFESSIEEIQAKNQSMDEIDFEQILVPQQHSRILDELESLSFQKIMELI